MLELDCLAVGWTDAARTSSFASGTRRAATGKIRGGAVTLLAELGHVGARAVGKAAARMPSADARDQLRTRPDELSDVSPASAWTRRYAFAPDA
ncbi:hypothetical protein ACFWAP_16865 [Streptomyces goshikiensis]|uniref:hypothetical protein n=1 Tax=Streptomyces goshikiensis TaxID=1942 RepID=UPI0036492D3A